MREIDRVIHLLARLPGLGPRSARRAALALIRDREGLMRPLSQALAEAADAVKPCSVCGNLDTVDPCGICTNHKRDRAMICVVEQIGDLWAMERSGAFSGLYHVLGGVLSAIDGVGPEDLTVAALVARCRTGEVREVILATNLTVDGQTTAHYIAERLAETGVTLTRLAPGVPVGGELDYLDDGTLAAALAARRSAS